jgi:hypothetical protein
MSVTEPESVGFGSILKDIFHQVGHWFRSGEPPPRAQVKSIYLMIFLNLFGFAALTVFFLAFFEVRFVGVFTSIIPIAFVAFLTLCPGLYGAWLCFACWRRFYGYDWLMVPNYD